MAGLFDLITTGLRRRADREAYVSHAMLMDIQRRADDAYAPERSRKEILATYDPEQTRAHRPDMSVVPNNAVRTHGWASGDDRYRFNHRTIDAIDERRDEVRRNQDDWVQRLSEPTPPKRPSELSTKDDTSKADEPRRDNQSSKDVLWTETPEYAERIRWVREQNERVQKELERQRDLKRQLLDQAREIVARDTQAAALKERMQTRSRDESTFYASQSAPAATAAATTQDRAPRSDQDRSSTAKTDRLSGELTEHGHAPYRFDERSSTPSYYVSLKNDDGKESTHWGKDLERAVNESGAQVGERIALARTGQDAAVQVRTAEGDVQSATRRGWTVDRIDQPTEQHDTTSASRPETARVQPVTPAHDTRADVHHEAARVAVYGQPLQSESLAQTTPASHESFGDTTARSETARPMTPAAPMPDDERRHDAGASNNARPPVEEDPDLVFDEEAVPAQQLSEDDLFPLTLTGEEYESAAALSLEPDNTSQTDAMETAQETQSVQVAPMGAERLAAWREQQGDEAQTESGGTQQGQGEHPAALTLELESQASQNHEPEAQHAGDAPSIESTAEPAVLNHDDDDMGYSFGQSTPAPPVEKPQGAVKVSEDDMGYTFKPPTQTPDVPAVDTAPAQAPTRRTMKR